MPEWWKEVVTMLGFRGHRPSPRELRDPAELAREIKERAEEIEAREDARRRVEALDVRLDVLTRRLTVHERKKQH